LSLQTHIAFSFVMLAPFPPMPAMREEPMSRDGKERRRGPVPLAELVGRVVDPVIAKRGFAGADLIAAWPAIVGQAYADFTQPERLLWPRTREAAEPAAGVLFLKVDGPRAIFLQHELPQIRERINAFLGYAAIGQIRLAQGPVQTRTAPVKRLSAPLTAAAEADLAQAVGGVADAKLRSALDRLGRGVLAERNKRT
jgi:hypothetical protein